MSTTAMLPAELTIYTAAQTRQAWLDLPAAATDEPLRLQASAVAEIDGAGLQLLVALRHSLAAQQRALHLLEPSPTLRTACARSGLEGLLIEGSAA